MLVAFLLLQLYTQVEAFASCISKLQELGLQVNVEESELVYRGTAGENSAVLASRRLVSYCNTATCTMPLSNHATVQQIGVQHFLQAFHARKGCFQTGHLGWSRPVSCCSMGIG